MRALNLALVIADHEVRGMIEGFGAATLVDGRRWLDVSPLHPPGTSECDDAVERAVRYIGLRHADAFPWRFIRHPDRPELVRFEERT